MNFLFADNRLLDPIKAAEVRNEAIKSDGSGMTTKDIRSSS